MTGVATISSTGAALPDRGATAFGGTLGLHLLWGHCGVFNWRLLVAIAECISISLVSSFIDVLFYQLTQLERS